MANGVVIPPKMKIKTVTYSKAVNYTANTGGYDSISGIDTAINATNAISFSIQNSGVGAVQGLQLMPCFFNGQGDVFFNYYAPIAVNTTLTIVIKYYDYE